MKRKKVVKAVYTGEATDKAFITGCRIKMLSALKKRGILTEKELQRGLALLKERIR